MDRRQRLVHSSISLHVDAANKHVKGQADLVIQPLADKLKYIAITCKGYQVDEACVDGIPVIVSKTNSTIIKNPAETLSQCFDRRSLDLHIADEIDCYDSGNLFIKLPRSVRDRLRSSGSGGRTGSMNTDEIDITSVSASAESEDVTKHVITISIRFHLSSHNRGLVWRTTDAGLNYLVCGTSRSDPSTWFPCIESSMEPCLYESDESRMERCSFECDLNVDAGYHGIASGSLLSRKQEHGSDRVIYSYSCDIPIETRAFGIAVAPFVVKVDPKREDVTHYVLQQDMNALVSTIDGVIEPIMQHFETVLDSMYPFDKLSCVWLPSCPFRAQAFAGLCVFDTELLCDATVIDAVYSIRPLIARTIALSWLTIMILQSPVDQWIAFGLSGWLVQPLIQTWFGHNEAEWQSLAASLECVASNCEKFCIYPNFRPVLRAQMHSFCHGNRAVHIHPVLGSDAAEKARAVANKFSVPLSWNGYLHPSECDSWFIRTRSSIVFRMLEQRIGRVNFKSVLARLLEESCENVESGAVNDVSFQPTATLAETKLAMSSTRLLDVCREVSGDLDVAAFFSQWVNLNCFPLLHCHYYYNTKKKATIVEMIQWHCKRDSKDAEGKRRDLEAVRFMGPMKFRIHESERLTEQERGLDNIQLELEFACHSKVRRNRKRKQYDPNSLAQLSLDKLLARHNDTPVLWLRADTSAAFFQPPAISASEVMCAAQLSGDKDVRGQADAILAMQRLFLFPKSDRFDIPLFDHVIHDLKATEGDEDLRIAEESCIQAVNTRQNFYAVRALAAQCLIHASAGKPARDQQRLIAPVFKCAIQGLVDLTSLPQSATEPTAEMISQCSLKANDFSDLSEYFSLRSFLYELSLARDSDTDLTPPIIVALVLRVLQANDNSSNPMNDAHHLASCLRALGNIRTAKSSTSQRSAIVAQLKRYQAYDRILPSPSLVVTSAVIDAATDLELAHQIPHGSIDIVQLTRHANVRVSTAAFTACIRLVTSSTAKELVPVLCSALEPAEDADTHKQRIIVNGWIDLLINCAVQSDWAREPSAESMALCSTLWRALVTENDENGIDWSLRTQLGRLWQLLYQDPRPVHLMTRAQLETSTAFYNELHKTTSERRRSEVVGAAWRRNTAIAALKTVRAKRTQQAESQSSSKEATDTPPPVLAVGKFKLKVSSSGSHRVTQTLEHEFSHFENNEKMGQAKLTTKQSSEQ